jgi:hypothetical protein
MPTKKKTTSGPKATLMKKNLAQLKAQAKKLKIKGFSTKKKEALVNSIMMAQARKKKSSAPKKSMAAGGKRMMKKRGAKPNRVMRSPVRPMAQRRRPMMSEYNGWANWYTWVTNLYFEQMFQMIVDEAAENPGGAYLPEDAYELGQVYKDLVEEMNDEVLQGDGTRYIYDMLNRGMLEVDWSEIGSHYIE